MLALALSGPPLPYEDWGACPFECCAYRNWTATRDVKVNLSRNPRSPVAFSVKAGETVRALTGVVVVERATRVRLIREQGGTSPRGEDTVPARAGDVMHLLTDLGEGFSKGWLRGRLVLKVDTWPFMKAEECSRETERCTGVIEEEGRSTWWVKVRNALGQVGWTDRTADFANKDACG